jgi:tRNA A-37 threonylcarbamoyl transferase component Bud32
MIGRRIGSWILERELGHGGMGSVYEARHATLRTRAAVKVLSAGLESEESFRQRFHREAELQAQLRHPNVARVLDYLEDAGRWFLVIEYVDGGSLADRLARGEKVPRQQAIAWARQALTGLAHAHQNGIVHRDIKPANLLIGANGEIVVMDFGIARSDAAPGLTATGVTVGTPHYMSPEQIVAPDRVDRRSDIYSLGIVLYELLAGRKPFDAGSQFAILHAHVSEPPPPLRAIDPAIPSDLESIVMRALAKNPNDRFADCESMMRELDRAGAPAAPAFPATAASGATIHSSRLFEPAAMQSGGGLSPGEARNQRRRSFQRKLATGAVVTVLVATLLAVKLSSDEADAEPPPVTVTGTVAAPEPPPTTTTAEDPRPPDRKVERPPIIRPIRNNVIPPGITTATATPATPDVTQTQTVAPPPVPPPSPPRLILPERPRIAVIGIGKEPLLAGSLEQEMERRLDQFDVADEHGDADVSDLLAKKEKDVSRQALGAALLKGGFHILVLVRVAEGDRETISRFGIEGSVIAARMHLNAYLLPANRTIGPGWTQNVEYTETSAAAKARQAFIGQTADLRQAINDEWAALRAAGAGAR